MTPGTQNGVSEPARAAADTGSKLFSDLVGELDSIGKERDWVAEGAIEGSALVVLVAGEKTGKSWMAIDLAVSIVMGTAWLGAFPIRHPGEAWYVDCEYGPHEFTRRCVRVIRAKGGDPRTVLAKIKHVWGVGFAFAVGNEPAEQLFRLAKTRDPEVIIVDPLRNVLGDGDENSAADVVRVLGIASNFRSRADCPVLINHHLNRAGTMAGSRALRSRTDLLIEGSDEDEPTYSSIGRTIRRGDPIAKRFVVRIEHEDDDDDTTAKTRLLLRFEGESFERTSLPKTAARVLDYLRRQRDPVTKTDVREALTLSGETAAANLWKLKEAGLAEVTNGKWRVSTKTAFEHFAAEAERARAEGRIPDPKAEPETFIRPSRRRTR